MPKTLKKKTLAVKGERKQPRRKTVPLFLMLPDEKPKHASAAADSSRVWLATANLETIQVAARRQRPPTASGRLTFYTLSSPTERLKALQVASCAIQMAEERVLPLYGGRPWSCMVVVKDNPDAWYVFDSKGRVQPATLPHLLPYNTIQKKAWNGKKSATACLRGCTALVPPKFPKFYDADAYMRTDENYDELANLPSAATHGASSASLDRMRDWILYDGCQMTTLSNLAWTTDTETRRLAVSVKWTSPLGQTFRTRSAAHAEALLLCKRQATLDRVLLGISPSGKPVPPKPIGKRQGMTCGKWRFERDGLWVVGQEDEWRIERLLGNAGVDATNSISNASDACMTPLEYFIQCNRKTHQAARLQEMTAQAAGGIIVATDKYDESMVAVAVDGEASQQTSAQWNDLALKMNGDVVVDDSASLDAASTNLALSQSVKVASVPVKMSFTLREAEMELRTKWKQLSDDERHLWSSRLKGFNVLSDPSTMNDGDLPLSTSDHTASTSGKPISEEVVSIDDGPLSPADNTVENLLSVSVSPSPSSNETKSPASTSDHSMYADWSTFNLPPSVLKQVDRLTCRLNNEQIGRCYRAGLEHYDQVMRTVQLRDLHRELQDGFDVFRERGRGRYDMQLPAFDEPAFDFLADKAPWMPIVREILGKNVLLIHKGMFLSMPGAAPQPYHQDGLHLTRQNQKPCHAINVFVPLIDMTMQHGPTEFCLGSHVLGKEDLRREFCVTPTVPAGTPVIFDYRLGHRGLGNTASTCRPILYCTYACAADGKEFRDSVNFSRKRYRILGDLVCEEPTRDERATKRRLQF